MKLVTSSQMRNIDKKTIEGIGIPGLELMEKGKSKIGGKQVETVIRSPIDGMILERLVNREIRVNPASERIHQRPAADIGLAEEGFNVPGTIGNNWRWRFRKENLTRATMDAIGEMVDDAVDIPIVIYQPPGVKPPYLIGPRLMRRLADLRNLKAMKYSTSANSSSANGK